MNSEELAKINQLYNERGVLLGSLATLKQPGMVIVGLQLSSSAPIPEPPLWISTQSVQYPPTMIDAIKNQLEARIDALDKELSQSGFTVSNAAHHRSARK